MILHYPYSAKKTIYVTQFSTPLGDMVAAGMDEGLCLLDFADRPCTAASLKYLERTLTANICKQEHRLFKLLQKELLEYFSGTLKVFSMPLIVPGTEFQKRVWELLLEIPYGQTWSYKQQAALLGCEQSVRAVARANGQNRLSLLIPCHRVIGSDGSLTGYGGGLWRKEQLLMIEKGQTVVNRPPVEPKDSSIPVPS